MRTRWADAWARRVPTASNLIGTLERVGTQPEGFVDGPSQHEPHAQVLAIGVVHAHQGSPQCMERGAKSLFQLAFASQGLHRKRFAGEIGRG